MCINFETSLTTGLLVLVGAIYLVRRGKPGDILIAALLMGSGLMQFVEAYVWTHMDDPQNPLYIASTLTAQVPFFTFVAYWYASSHSILRVPWFLVLYVTLICIYLFYSVHNLWTTTIKQHTTQVGPHGHLDWNIEAYKRGPLGLSLHSIYLLLLIVSLIPYLNIRRVRHVFILLFLFFAYSYIQYQETMEFGSIWCWMTNLIMAYAVFF